MLAFSWKLAGKPLKFLRRIVILIIGGTVLLIGIAMIVLPGPATVVIPVGLAILSIEFVWAKKLLARAKEMIRNGINQVKSSGKKSTPSDVA